MRNNDNIKEEVKQKAKELFFRYGPKHVSMDEIAEGSAMSKKTLYQFFESKNTIVQEVVDDLVLSHELLFENSRTNASDAIDEVLKQDTGLTSICTSLRPSFFLEIEIFFPDTWTQLEQYKSRIQRGIVANLEKGKIEGLYREDLNVNLISNLRLQQLANLFRPGVLTNLSLSVKDLNNEFTLLYLHSICTEKGRKQLHQYLEKRN